MNTLIKAIAFISIIGISFIAGKAYDAIVDFWKKPVTVKLFNQSQHPLASIHVLYSDHRTKGSIQIVPVDHEKSTSIRFYLAGEGDFSLEVKLANGKVLRDNEGYTEGGYTFEKTVTDSTIITNTSRAILY